MCTKLRAAGFQPLQFKLNTAKPDLTRLDTLLNLMGTDTTQHAARGARLAQWIRQHGVAVWRLASWSPASLVTLP